MSWHLITCEYPPDVGGISDHTAQVATGLAAAGDEVHVWCPGLARAAPPGVHVHGGLGAFGRADLERVGQALDAHAAPRRLVVQWVPHGFGKRSMNLWFCLWVWRRARRGDAIDVVVHEPYLEFRRGRVLHLGMALVHRLMTIVLLRAADRVWMSTPAWEDLLRPYLLGREMDMRWLPVPGCESRAGSLSTGAITDLAALSRPLVGHFGTYGTLVASLLEERLIGVMASSTHPALVLMGAGGDVFAQRLVTRHPEWRDRVLATGYVSPERLHTYLSACDVLLQPYPDGITTRRTSAMAGLARGRAVVTTTGHLTESLWAEHQAVLLVDAADPGRFVAEVDGLLRNGEARERLGARARAVYDAHFSVSQLVHTLRAA
jgi:glycosyltransferase involved in cell wall biosynthesis